jgi:hypothetical protein
MDAPVSSSRFAPLILGALVAAGCAGLGRSDPAPSLGPLPAQPISILEVAGVRGEVSLPFLVDSSSVADLVPEELRVVRLRDLARFDSAAGAYFGDRPDRGGWVVASLAVAVVDSMRIAGTPAPSSSGSYATWWAMTWPAPAVDDRANVDEPRPGWLQLGAWIDDPSYRGHLFSRADVARISARREPSGLWRIEMQAPDLRVTARCQLYDERRPTEQPIPAYVIVWEGGESVTFFGVMTFHGHHSQPCTAEWSAEGEHPLARALQRVTASELAFLIGGPANQDGWRARGGYYRH